MTTAFQANAFQTATLAFQIDAATQATFSQYGRRVGTSWNPNWNNKRKKLKAVDAKIGQAEARLERLQAQALQAENAKLRANIAEKEAIAARTLERLLLARQAILDDEEAIYLIIMAID